MAAGLSGSEWFGFERFGSKVSNGFGVSEWVGFGRLRFRAATGSRFKGMFEGAAG